MTASLPSLLRRRISSTMLWTLSLLLLTNVLWSIWAATSCDSPFAGTRSRISFAPVDDNKSCFAEVFASTTKSFHEVYLSPADSDGSLARRERTVSGTAPLWLRRALSGQRMHEASPDAMWEFSSVGFPFRMLWHAVQLPHGYALTGFGSGVSPRNDSSLMPHTGITVSKSGRGASSDVVLPIRPILAGQVFYAVFWFGLLLMASFVHRRVRIWRGRCPTCNYDLRATTTGTCPECGADA
ncbi:MAG: hypothetical protein IT430_03605 [Phycisphaerales bacterium]|nr:hypothetical protein [Phycisphaerales bacterium]